MFERPCVVKIRAGRDYDDIGRGDAERRSVDHLASRALDYVVNEGTFIVTKFHGVANLGFLVHDRGLFEILCAVVDPHGDLVLCDSDCVGTFDNHDCFL